MGIILGDSAYTAHPYLMTRSLILKHHGRFTRSVRENLFRLATQIHLCYSPGRSSKMMWVPWLSIPSWSISSAIHWRISKNHEPLFYFQPWILLVLCCDLHSEIFAQIISFNWRYSSMKIVNSFAMEFGGHLRFISNIVYWNLNIAFEEEAETRC